MKRRMQMLNWMVSIFLYLSAISPASAWLSDPHDFYEGKGSWILNGIEYAYNVDSGEAQIKKIDEDQVGAVSLRVPTIVRLPRRYRFDIVVDPAQDTGDPNNEMRIGIDWSDYLVTSIANRACVCGRITSLTIPSNIKRIGDEAFDSCLDLERLIFEGDVDSLGKNAFSMCKSLEYVRLKSVKEIGNNVFAVCDSLKTVVYDGEIERIGENMFGGCTALTQLVWPRGLKEIGDGAYSGTGITELRELPLGVTLGASVFGGCQDLREVCWPSSHSYIPYGTFGGCGNLCKLSIPGQVIMIGEEAFSWCDNLVDVTFSEGLLEIGTNAFQSCTGLSNVSFPDTLQIIRYGAFSFDANLDVEHWPKDLSIVEESSFWNCLALTNLDLSSTQISEIGGGAFSESEELVSIIFPESLVKIGDYAFYTHRWYLSKTIVYFMGKPPQMGSGVFYRAIESGSLAGEVHRWFHTARYLPEFKEEWMEAIAAWKSENEGFGEWQGLDFQTEIDVEPTDWRLLADGKTQFLTISWYIPTNENYSINQSLRDLTAKDLRFSIWRSQGDDENWRSFENAECIAQNLAGTDFTDFAFGKIKGTCPVRYWVEVQDKHGEPTSPAERARPHVEPAHCDTRRRFGLAVGVSEFGQEWNGVAHPPHGLKQIKTSTERFAKILRDGGGVVGFDDLTVLLDEDATLDRVSREIARLPYDANGVKRLVPGDEVYLWMFSHGIYATGGTPETLCGGIDLYDGYYFSGMAGVLPLKPEDPPARSTFNADLSWVDEYPGVRIVGILPFCHSKLMCRDFMDRENVAWITAAEERESAASSNMEDCDYTQFCEYFLNSGIEKGLANLSGVIGRPYQDVKSISVGGISRDSMGHTPILLADLTRYAKNLSFGFGSECPAHVDMSGAVNILEDLQVADATVENGSAPRALSFGVRTDDKGFIELDMEIKDCTDVLVWFRRVGAGSWRWVSIHAMVSKLGFGRLSSGTRATLTFGRNTEDDVFRMGPFYPNEMYQFAVQGVNHYGYGPVNGPMLATTGDIPVDAATARRLLREKMEYLMGGVCFAMSGEGDTTAQVSASRSDAGYHVSAAVTAGGESGTYGADATADDIGEDGTLHLICHREDGGRSLSDSLEVVLSVDGAVCMVNEKLLFCLRESSESYRLTSRCTPGENLSIQTPEVGMEGVLTYAAQGLPRGLSINASTGEIVGKVLEPGSYVVLVTVKSKTDPTQTETIEVPIVIGNYVDETIAVDDEYGPYVPGEKVELKFPDGAAWKVTGLPTGLKLDAKLPGVTGVPTKPGTNTVTFTWTDKTVKPNVTHKASSTFIVGPLPVLSVLPAGEGTGKVTGAGAYAANKKVTLKATADTKDAVAKGKNPATVKSVFAGWYDATGELVAQTPSLSYIMPPYDVTLQARFIPASNDWATADCVMEAGSVLVVSNETKVAIAPISVVAAGGSLPTVKVAGLPSGLKFTAKDILKKGSKTEVEIPANTIYGTPTKGGVYNATVTVTTAGKASVVRAIKFIIRTASDYVADADWDPVQGKVTGVGVYQSGKKVTLKATANKGYVFAGWYGEEGLGGLGGLGGLVTQAASYAFTMPTNDVAYVAKFVTTDEDEASISANVNGMAFGAGSGGDTPVLTHATNVMTGVYLEWPIAADALSLPTVKVAGLPSGLKFTAKPVTTKVTSGTGSSRVTTVVTNVPANTIYGTPTKASTVDKYGDMKPSTVKITVTTAGKSKADYVISLTVDPIPAFAVGTFDGWYGEGEDVFGSATLTLAANGKVSGKVLMPVDEKGKTYNFKADSLSGFSRADDGSVTNVTVAATLTGENKAAVPLALTFTPDEIGIGCAEGAFDEPWSGGLWLAQNGWKRGGYVFPYIPKDIVKTLDDGLTLTFKKNGVVSIGGKIVGDDGVKLVSAKGSAQLVSNPESADGFFLLVYVPPAKNLVSGLCRLYDVKLDGPHDDNEVTEVQLTELEP